MTDFRAEREMKCRVQCIRDHLDWIDRLLPEQEPKVVKKEFHFDFGVYYVSEAQAGDLLGKIAALVEEMDGAHIGGGYREYEAEETTQN